ncbi:MAG TPA: hypothetical protein VMS65_18085 [Polyangiaceae bacterium]|nr:hypothetical protein [Polyangiaceae bacterium]
MAEADDLEALVIPSSVKLAGAMLMGTGACIGVVGLQALGLGTTGLLSLVGPLGVMLSGGCMYSGFGVVRGRARFAQAGLGLGAVTALFALTWAVFAFLNGVLLPMSLLAVPLSITATTLVAVGMKAVKKIDEARERLRTQGLDAGL